MDDPKQPRSLGPDQETCLPEPCAQDPCTPHPGALGQRLSRANGGEDGPNPNRPTRSIGSETGRLRDGGPLNICDIQKPNPPGVFVGPRADMDLPYLFIRANAADLGGRPITNAPFWESPDIIVLAGVTPAHAPPIPPIGKLGDVALVGEPNTLYAHIWNFGKASAHEVIVEFYWCDPSLGITASSVRLIAQVMTSLGHKGSGKCHRVVKCPEAWSPVLLNGGHECLLVRVWDNPSDFPGEPKFDACWNRHVAQRNIHVVKRNGGPMPLVLHPGAAPQIMPAFQDTLLLNVGNLYGEPAWVEVVREAPSDMPWLQLHTGVRGSFPAAAPPTGDPMLSPPAEGGAGFPAGGALTQHVVGSDQVIAFATSDHAPAPGQAHVYRVRAHQGGVVFGGYTIVVLG